MLKAVNKIISAAKPTNDFPADEIQIVNSSGVEILPVDRAAADKVAAIKAAAIKVEEEDSSNVFYIFIIFILILLFGIGFYFAIKKILIQIIILVHILDIEIHKIDLIKNYIFINKACLTLVLIILFPIFSINKL